MNQDQFMSLLRTGLAVAGGFALAHGVNDQLWGLLSGAALALAPLFWGYFAHTTDAKMASVEALRGVESITVKPSAPDDLRAMVLDPERPKVLPQS